MNNDVRRDNWLGVALSALMRIPKREAARLGSKALRRLVGDERLTGQQRFLLGECVEAYLPPGEAEKAEFARILEMGAHKRVKAVNMTTSEKDEAADKLEGVLAVLRIGL